MTKVSRTGTIMLTLELPQFGTFLRIGAKYHAEDKREQRQGANRGNECD